MKLPENLVSSAETKVEKNPSFADHIELLYDSKDNMKFSSKATIEKLEAIYNRIEYFEKFHIGNPDVYDYYVETYTKLLKNEVDYYDPVYKNIETLHSSTMILTR